MTFYLFKKSQMTIIKYKEYVRKNLYFPLLYHVSPNISRSLIFLGVGLIYCKSYPQNKAGVGMASTRGGEHTGVDVSGCSPLAPRHSVGKSRCRGIAGGRGSRQAIWTCHALFTQRETGNFNYLHMGHLETKQFPVSKGPNCKQMKFSVSINSLGQKCLGA